MKDETRVRKQEHEQAEEVKWCRSPVPAPAVGVA